MEWCLSATQPPDECIHLYASVRDNGSTIRSGNISVLRKQLLKSKLYIMMWRYNLIGQVTKSFRVDMFEVADL